MGHTQGVIRGVSGSLEIPHVLCIYLYIIASILQLARVISCLHSAYKFQNMCRRGIVISIVRCSSKRSKSAS